MKCKKILFILMTMVMIGNHALVYAGEPQATPIQNEAPQESLAELYHKAGLDSPEVIMNTLKALGISEEALKEAVQADQKIYDLLQEKEIPLKDFKKALTKEYQYRIKQAKKNKVITKKEAKILTDFLRERMNMWEI